MRLIQVLALVCCAAGCRHSHDYDLVVTNARIWTEDPLSPEIFSLAVKDGRFVQLADCPTSFCKLSDRTQIINAGGARIIPGLIDAHIHLVSGGLQLTRLNLRDVPNRAAFVNAIAERAKATPSGEWILGGRWSTESWPDVPQPASEGLDPTQPTKEWIDHVTPNNPVLLSRMDGHGALANSVALRSAGITKAGPADPLGGKIERHPLTREPTGILKDTAIDLVERLVPKPSDSELDDALQRAIQHAHSHGLTGVHTMSEWSDLAVFERARKANRLDLRVRMYVIANDWPPYVEKAKQYRGDDWLRICGFKDYMDGSLGSRSAYMAQPFADQPDNRGLARHLNHTELTNMCGTVIEAGFAPTFHAIGDQANHMILDCYETTGRPIQKSKIQNPRIEHAQHLLPDDIPRFGKLGVIASMQPYHKADDGRYAETAIGPERCKTSYAFRSLLDTGAHLAFGSDWPVVSLNPFLGIHAAVTGKTLDGKVFVPEQNITLEEALRGYTSGAAYASGDDFRLGMIKPGYLADFVILDQDPFKCPTDRLSQIRVRQTFVAGRAVYP